MANPAGRAGDSNPYRGEERKDYKEALKRGPAAGPGDEKASTIGQQCLVSFTLVAIDKVSEWRNKALEGTPSDSRIFWVKLGAGTCYTLLALAALVECVVRGILFVLMSPAYIALPFANDDTAASIKSTLAFVGHSTKMNGLLGTTGLLTFNDENINEKEVDIFGLNVFNSVKGDSDYTE